MRVLCLTPELPFAPGGTGGSTRQFHLLRRLVERGDEVEVVSPVHPDQRAGAERLQAAGVALRAVHRPPSRVAETLGALRSRPGLVAAAAREPLVAWQVDVFWSALRPLALAAIAERRPDVVLVEHDWAAGWARDLPDDIPRALTLHNLSWDYYEARTAAASGVRRALLGAEARRFARHDARLLCEYGLLLAMSDRDAAAVRTLGVPDGVDVEVVPNGVDAAALDLGPPPADPTVLFTGRLDYPPNAEALVWLLRDIWPQVRAERPDARLLAVGPNPPEEARRLADASVELPGWVEDMRPWFARASVVAVPMRSGGGTRLKVVDALASGRGIVSTTMGAQGIDVRDGEHLVLADEAPAFAAATARLLGDAAERERLGAAARALAAGRYDWTAIGDRLRDALARLSARS